MYPEYSEDIPLGFLSPIQFYRASYDAAEQLNWQFVSVSEQLIVCQTPGNETSQGEAVTISIGYETARFHSRSVHEQFLAEGQNEANAALFKDTVANHPCCMQ